MKVLITGGAGYIGFITARELRKAGHEVIIFDHFNRHLKTKIEDFPYLEGDLKNPEETNQAIAKTEPEAVIHFAAYIQMGESVKNPKKYYKNNVVGSFNLVNAMVDNNLDKIVFSSSAGVYGNPETLPIKEDARKQPTNPYGETKLAVERMLRWYEKPYGLSSISLRYFNAAGATLDGKYGEDHDKESHLIPSIIQAQLKNQKFTLFGDDYDTPDGTCLRDYIHVLDLASAHIKALEKLEKGSSSAAYNVGTGNGYTNKEIIEMIKKVSGKPINLKIGKRRPGDAAKLIADVSKIKKELDWQPQHSDLETIIESSYKFHAKRI